MNNRRFWWTQRAFNWSISTRCTCFWFGSTFHAVLAIPAKQSTKHFCLIFDNPNTAETRMLLLRFGIKLTRFATTKTTRIVGLDKLRLIKNMMSHVVTHFTWFHLCTWLRMYCQCEQEAKLWKFLHRHHRHYSIGDTIIHFFNTVYRQFWNSTEVCSVHNSVLTYLPGSNPPEIKIPHTCGFLFY